MTTLTWKTLVHPKQEKEQRQGIDWEKMFIAHVTHKGM